MYRLCFVVFALDYFEIEQIGYDAQGLDVAEYVKRLLNAVHKNKMQVAENRDAYSRSCRQWIVLLIFLSCF